MTMDFKEKGDLIFLLGESKDDISSSEYLASIHGIKGSPAPFFDIDREFNVQKAVRSLINLGIINSAHDVFFFEMGLNRGLGFDITSDADVRLDSFLFGEAQSRIAITIDGNSEEALIDELRNHEVPFTLLGHVTRGKMVVDDEHFGFIADAKEMYNTAIERKMDSAVSELSID